jgi:[CysO sulfur-carrier protein]-S-L-cysteine hydrolase
VPESIKVPRAILAKMMEEARADLSQECCGLLAGRGVEVTRIFPARNALASATAYEIAAEELFALFREIRAYGPELTGIYHSHPRGENSPSRTDLERAYYPDAVYFIVSPLLDVAKPVRAFRIRDGLPSELDISIIE